MICRSSEKELSAYLDGELTASRARRLEAHLKVCQRCRQELDAMIGISSHIKAASGTLEVSRDFDQRVLRAVGYLQISGRRTRGRQRSVLMRILVLVLSALALLGFTWHLLHRPPVAEPQPSAAMIAPATGAPGAPLGRTEQRRR